MIEIAPPPSTAAICDALAELQRERRFHIKTVNRFRNAMAALVRRALGWSMQADEKTRAAIEARTQRILDAARRDASQKPEDAAIAAVFAAGIAATEQACRPFESRRAEVEKDMASTVAGLPAHLFAAGVRGLSLMGLAVIIGEAGDLGRYETKQKLWKRLGLAPYKGRSLATWRGKKGLTAEDWTEAGYNPQRRAELHACIATPLLYAQGKGADAGPYRAIYDRRRAHTAVTHPEWAKAHAKMDALRIMTQRLVADLWRFWRRMEAPRLAEAA